MIAGFRLQYEKIAIKPQHPHPNGENPLSTSYKNIRLLLKQNKTFSLE